MTQTQAPTGVVNQVLGEIDRCTELYRNLGALAKRMAVRGEAPCETEFERGFAAGQKHAAAALSRLLGEY